MTYFCVPRKGILLNVTVPCADGGQQTALGKEAAAVRSFDVEATSMKWSSLVSTCSISIHSLQESTFEELVTTLPHPIIKDLSCNLVHLIPLSR